MTHTGESSNPIAAALQNAAAGYIWAPDPEQYNGLLVTDDWLTLTCPNIEPGASLPANLSSRIEADPMSSKARATDFRTAAQAALADLTTPYFVTPEQVAQMVRDRLVDTERPVVVDNAGFVTHCLAMGLQAAGRDLYAELYTDDASTVRQASENTPHSNDPVALVSAELLLNNCVTIEPDDLQPGDLIDLTTLQHPDKQNLLLVLDRLPGNQYFPSFAVGPLMPPKSENGLPGVVVANVSKPILFGFDILWPKIGWPRPYRLRALAGLEVDKD